MRILSVVVPLLAVTLIAAVVAGVLAAARWIESVRPTLDPETLCPVAGPTGRVTLILDTTDSWSDAQLGAVRELVADIARDLRPGDRFAVYEIPARLPALVTPRFAMCSPGSGRDVNTLIEGAQHAQRRFETRFLRPLHAWLGTLPASHTAPASPVLEVIVAVAAREALGAPSGRRALFVASDLLQNYGALSHYRGLPVPPPGGTAGAGALSGADVRVLYIANPSALLRQTDAHVEWWRQVFLRLGARGVTFEGT